MDDLVSQIRDILRGLNLLKEPDNSAEAKFFILPFYESVSVSDAVAQPTGTTTGTYVADTAKVGESDYG